MSVHCEIRGEGPDLVLLHGWAMHGGVWGEFIDQLIPHARVHIVDLPGHGGSAPMAPYTVENLMAAIAAQVPQHAMWVGWSLGGMVAVAAAHRGHASRLGLMASSPCFAQRADWPCAMAEPVLQGFMAALQQDASATVQRFLALQALGSPAAREHVATLKTRLAQWPQPSAAQLGAGLSLLQTEDWRSVLPTLQLPIALIYGARDTLVPVAVADYLSAVWPHATRTVLAQSAHAPFMTHPAETAAALLDVLHA